MLGSWDASSLKGPRCCSASQNWFLKIRKMDCLLGDSPWVSCLYCWSGEWERVFLGSGRKESSCYACGLYLQFQDVFPPRWFRQATDYRTTWMLGCLLYFPVVLWLDWRICRSVEKETCWSLGQFNRCWQAGMRLCDYFLSDYVVNHVQHSTHTLLVIILHVIIS